jgi:hypothetical protein
VTSPEVEDMMLRIGIVLVAFAAIAGVITLVVRHNRDDGHTVAYHVTHTGTASDGSSDIVVVRDGDGWRGGRGFFPFFPLLVLGGVLVTVGLLTRGKRHRWADAHFGGPGGMGGPGGFGGPRFRDRAFEEWHRAAHREDPNPKDVSPPPPPSAGEGQG